MAMKNYSRQLHIQLEEVVVEIRSSSISNNDRKKLNAVLIIDVYTIRVRFISLKIVIT